MKRFATPILLMGLLVTTMPQAVGQTAQLRLSDGIITIVVTDQDPYDSDPRLGVVSFNGSVGTDWSLNSTAGTTKPDQGGALFPYMDIGTVNVSSLASGRLTIEFSESGFIGVGTGEARIGGTTAGTVTFTNWADAGNVNFAKTTLLTSQGPFGPVAFSDTTPATLSLATPYSLTLETVIEHPGFGLTEVSGFNAGPELPPPAPECPPTTRDLGCNPTPPTCEDAQALIAPTVSCSMPTTNCIAGPVEVISDCARSQTFTNIVSCDGQIETTCLVTFTWTEDTQKPQFTKCPENRDLGCNPENIPGCDTSPDNVMATDNCGTPTITCASYDGPVVACVHSRTNVYTAMDQCGNSNECVQVITWKEDTTPPDITCPPDITVEADPHGPCQKVVTFDVTANDNCDGPVPVTCDPPSGSVFPAGETTVNCTTSDECENPARCSFKVNVACPAGECRVTGGSNHQTNTYQSACIKTALPTHISHGGQVGAPFSVGTPFTPNSPCISGEWQHNRHLRANRLVGNFHAAGNGNERQFDSLLCACLPCDENPGAVGLVGQICNPGDRICGPEPRRAPANKITFSGVGDYTFTTGNKTVKAVFRVDIEDRSEGNSPSSTPPPDRYRIRLWLLDPSCGRTTDPNSAEAMALRFAASADPAKIAVLATTEDLKVNIPPDIDDGGDMTQGNHQIHPATSATCSESPAPIAAMDVATDIACLQPGGICSFGKVAQGYQGMEDPAFIYRITITNSGITTLTDLSVSETTGSTLLNTTGLFFAPGEELPPGGSLVRYYTNTCSADTIRMVTVAGKSTQGGAPAYAASTAMASVGAAEVTCTVSLSSPADLDTNANDNHVLVRVGSNAVVRLNVQVCNTGQSDLFGVTVTNSGLNCSWPIFDLPKDGCTNLVCEVNIAGPNVPIVSQVMVNGKVKPGCSQGAYTLGGANVTVRSAGSGTVEGLQPPPPPTSPTGLTVVSGATKVTLTWKPFPGAISYKVKRSTIPAGPYTTIKSGLTTTSYVDTAVVNGTVYYYVVSAVTATGETANSAQVNAIPATSLPSPWQTRDIGSVAATGGANYSGGTRTFTAVGSGADIWGTADACRYIHQLGNGDCSIVARVLSVQNTDPWAKAGVMIRETLNANAKHASVFVTPGNGVAGQSRVTTGGNSVNVNTAGLKAPYWVKLVRRGNTFTAYRSATGQHNKWTQVASLTISMGQSVYLGLAVTSHKDGALCTAAFDNITVTP